MTRLPARTDDDSPDGGAMEWAVAAALMLVLTAALAWMATRRPVYVGFASHEVPQRARPDMRLNLNTATVHDLEALPRLGPALAARLVADREVNGPFASLDDLRRVPGIGPRTIELIAPHLVIRPVPGDDEP